MHRVTVPVAAELHEQVVHDGVGSDKCLAAWHVGIALGLMPVDVRRHRPKNRWNVALTECLVELLHCAYVVHAFPGFEWWCCRPCVMRLSISHSAVVTRS